MLADSILTVNHCNNYHISPKEPEEKKLICLLPFSMLRLRKKVEQFRTPENITALQNLINHDIFSAIIENEAVGNISAADAASLRDITDLTLVETLLFSVK